MPTRDWDSFFITTKRLHLLACDAPMLQALAAGDKATAQYLQVEVPPRWSAFGPSIYQYTLLQLKKNPANYIWWTYLAILTETETLIGAGGFKGPPDEKGLVEIGYEIAKPYRRQGFATEMARGLIEYAFSHHNIHIVQAHTKPKINASSSVLKKCGMQKVQEIELGEDGQVWQWQVEKGG
jgi:ribosomal-protein-alanine N-acetyltransferase